MSDFRHDPVFDRWVCIAESRQERPLEFRQEVHRLPGLACPFCPGNEEQTPLALVEHNRDGRWQVRVIPNKFPALTPGSGSARTLENRPEAGGRQEVIVISPRHIVSLAELEAAEIQDTMHVFGQRTRDYLDDPGIRHASLFMNCRPFAGASIEHAHFQLMGSPICTDEVRLRVMRMIREENGLSLWQAELRRELENDIRVVEQTDELLVFCPRASRYTGLLRFAPRESQPFARWEEGAFARLGKIIVYWTRVMEQLLDMPAYNLVYYLPHNEMPDAPWFVDLIPRFPQFAGFELATDCWVNPLSPETAASRYRKQAASFPG